jgi:hypothetical protein
MYSFIRKILTKGIPEDQIGDNTTGFGENRESGNAGTDVVLERLVTHPLTTSHTIPSTRKM